MSTITSTQTSETQRPKDLSYLAIDDALRHVKFPNHAQRDGTTTWLGVVHLTLEHDSVNVLFLGKDLGSASSRRASSDDGNLVFHVESRS